MLKKFFLNLLSSFMGAWIALVLFGVVAVIVTVGVCVSIGSAGIETPSIKKHSIMVFDLKGTIDEAHPSIPFNAIDFVRGDIERPAILSDIVNGLKEGRDNKNIDALYIKCNGVSAGVATLRTVRQAVEQFRKSGKKVYAYGDMLTQGDYYIASAADSIFLNGGGSVDLHGLGGEVMYYKDFFDKIGLTFEVVKVGTFKSAVEPFILNKMSEPARAQLDTLYGNIWTSIRGDISKARGMSPAALDSIVSRDLVGTQDARWALGHKLVDRVVYQRQMDDILGRIVGKEGKDVNYVDISVLSGQADWGADYGKDQVAVLYASGDIAESDKAGIYCEKLVPVIVQLADDDKVKGLVMRVNSPGGSVFGSEQIAEALQYFKSKKKPFAVSMGDYAASGGYWISADADRIFASPLTVTGSIGIFGLIPNVEGLARKLGVNVESVSTNPSADFPSLFRGFTPQQRAAMQANVDRGYDQFVKRVANGRKMSEKKVRAIAEGRVWDGQTALRLGLVDQLGGLDDAIKWVAARAGIKKDTKVGCYPKFEPGFWEKFREAASSEMTQAVADAVGDNVDKVALREALMLLRREPVQARMMPLRLKM